MPSPRKVSKPRRKATSRQSKAVDDDLALADELLRQARKDQPVIDAEWKKVRKALKQLGIVLPDKPVGAKKLYEMALREGLDSEGTEFSRGIIEMREE